MVAILKFYPRSYFSMNHPNHNTMMTNRYALTLGEQSEIHVGCEIHGEGLADEGFSVEELMEMKEHFQDQAELVILSDALPEDVRGQNKAAVLHIKDGVNLLMGSASYADEMLEEQMSVKYDEFYWDRRRQRMLNKIARHNAVFGERHIEASEDYRQSTVIGYDEVPKFQRVRDMLPEVFGEKARNLNSEGNHYYDPKSGIGYHGDCERKRVICCSLGTPTSLYFYWRGPGSSEACSQKFEFKLAHGDMYVMSEKATGFDWRMRSRYRLVHGAGARGYVEVKPKLGKRKRETKDSTSGEIVMIDEI